MATNRKTKAKKAAPAPVAKRESAPPRRALILWAEIIEMFNRFEDHVYARIDDDVFADHVVGDLKQTLLDLRGDLYFAVPQKWW